MKKIPNILIPILFSSLAHTQSAFTNFGNLQIHAGTSIASHGDFINSNSAAFINNGNFYLKRDVTNNQAGMTTGTGTLYFNGTVSQAINGTQKFKSYNLQTNNASGIVLNNDLSVTNLHTFSAGIITSSATPNYLVYEAGSSYSGDGDNRHVNGWVKKLGNTAFTFPVGNGLVERTITLNTLSASSEFSVRYYRAVPPNKTNALVPLLFVDSSEYWDVNEVSGGTAKVFMNWDNSKVPFPNWTNNTDIRVASYNGAAWSSAGGVASGNVATTGTITSNSVSSFNKLTFGGEAMPLPLTLLSFSAKYILNYTALSWVTADEINVDHFTVERSDDGNNFYDIAQFTARNSGHEERYSTTDTKKIDHIAYYRLRSVDIDGRSKLSRTIPVTVSAIDVRLLLLTNPIHDHITLVSGADLGGLFDYHIRTMAGHLLQQGKIAIQNGGQYELSLKESLKKGIYSLDVRNEKYSFVFRLVVD